MGCSNLGLTKAVRRHLGMAGNTGKLNAELQIITLCMLGKEFQQMTFSIFFFFNFPIKKMDLTLHANCLLRRRLA